METYNASEGFFGIQDDPKDSGMLLMLDYGVYYEFIPMEHFGRPEAEAIPLEGVEIGRNYAMIISTLGGFYRYVLGDTVRFTSVKPYKIVRRPVSESTRPPPSETGIKGRSCGASGVVVMTSG